MIPCPKCKADELHPVLCAESPSVHCRACNWQGLIERKDATSVEMRRNREAAERRKATKAKKTKRRIVGLDLRLRLTIAHRR